jgi:hypothetical protein
MHGVLRRADTGICPYEENPSPPVKSAQTRQIEQINDIKILDQQPHIADRWSSIYV